MILGRISTWIAVATAHRCTLLPWPPDVCRPLLGHAGSAFFRHSPAVSRYADRPMVDVHVRVGEKWDRYACAPSIVAVRPFASRYAGPFFTDREQYSAGSLRGASTI